MAEKVNYLPRETLFGLNAACEYIDKAFDGFGCYLVGSAIERKDYRDVDVRCILRDEDFERLFPMEDGNLRPRFILMCMALSAWLRHMTGLPVDFQFQKQTVANDKHKGPRHALGIFGFFGDAT